MLLKMIPKRFLASAFACALIFVTSGCSTATTQDAQVAAAPAVQPAQANPEQLQQLVAPIALYPDELVAEVLAASTYPTEVVQANRWLQQNSTLKDQQLATEVDKQPWDASVKALTEFPSVLANMDKNLSWTSSLGDAYYNHPQEVMDAVQVMRKRAENAGTLKTTQQQTVTTQGQTIVIEPTNPQVVYVPTYDPWVVYGAPLAVYPGYVDFFVGPYVSFGFGYPIGFFPYPWGWGFWGFNWGGGFVVFNHARFISHSHTFFDHGHGFAHGGDFHGHDFHGFHAVNFTVRPFIIFMAQGRGLTIGQPVDLLRRTWRQGRPPRRVQRIRPWRHGQPLLRPRPVQFRRRYSWRSGFNGGAHGGFAGGGAAVASGRFSWRRWRRPQVIGRRQQLGGYVETKWRKEDHGDKETLRKFPSAYLLKVASMALLRVVLGFAWILWAEPAATDIFLSRRGEQSLSGRAIWRREPRLLQFSAPTGRKLFSAATRPRTRTTGTVRGQVPRG